VPYIVINCFLVGCILASFHSLFQFFIIKLHWATLAVGKLQIYNVTIFLLILFYSPFTRNINHVPHTYFIILPNVRTGNLVVNFSPLCSCCAVNIRKFPECSAVYAMCYVFTECEFLPLKYETVAGAGVRR
jgi:hypothetical protein